ncbi:MAG: NAD(P)-dependent oxidoreductase [Chromatiales bacterium]|nr:NAD(P)-dependent oxidoreductase [Chromatiales bacterium]
MKRVLVTGAAGGIGTWLRQTLRGRYRLRLSDIEPITDLGDGEEQIPADLTDAAAVRGLMDGVDGIVHLGGVSKEAPWEPIQAVNIGGTYNLFEAARAADVERIVFASSNHAVGFYPRAQTIGADVTVRPDSRYGLSKVFGEALGALYADKYGRRVLCIRIGNVAEQPVDVRRLAIWVSPRDLTQLVVIGLEHPDLHYEIVYGMSDNARTWWDNANAYRLGYRPEDRSEDYAQEVLANAPPVSPTSLPDQMQGGDFTVVEVGGGAPRTGADD